MLQGEWGEKRKAATDKIPCTGGGESEIATASRAKGAEEKKK